MRSTEPGTVGNSLFYACPPPAAGDIFLYPMYLGHYYCSCRYSVDRTCFDSYLLLYVCAGTGVLVDTMGSHALQAGDLVLLDCYKPHRYFTKAGWEIYWLHFDGPQASRLYRYAQKRNRLIVSAAHLSVVRTFNQMIRCLHETASGQEVRMHKLITDLLTDLLQPAESAPGTLTKEAAADRAVRYLREHFQEKLTLAQLADQMNLSPWYLSHIFKEVTGTTIHQQLIQIRLDYAKYLLQSGNLPVQNIAEHCGFNDAGAFCACFKGRYGISPGQYRTGFR